MTTGSINGAVIQMLVDTGATFVALGCADAGAWASTICRASAR
jgi:predicted aspartyl protease